MKRKTQKWKSGQKVQRVVQNNKITVGKET